MSREFLYHGELISERGLEPVAQAVNACCWRLELRRSGYDGTLYLRAPRSQDIDLEMDSGQSGRYLFSGRVEGSLDRALTLLGDLSRCLTAGGYPHRVEVYGEAEESVGYFHHRWPPGRQMPSS